MVTKPKNTDCDTTQKVKLCLNSKTQIYEITPKLIARRKNLKTQIATKLKKLKF